MYTNVTVSTGNQSAIGYSKAYDPLVGNRSSPHVGVPVQPSELMGLNIDVNVVHLCVWIIEMLLVLIRTIKRGFKSTVKG